MADRRKLAQGLMMMTPSARADIAQQADEFERFKQADYLRKMGEQGAGLAKSVARGVPQMATGLVDLASMPFEAAGVLQPGQAVGSTKWLENRGYLPESQPGFANQLTELLSGGFDPSDLITKGAPMLAALRTTWHGSPHGFTKFDMSKIGTGEGAQAYGHGLYLAEARPTAESYMRTQLNNAPELEKMALNAGVSPDAANTLAQWYHNTKDKYKLDDFMETMRAEAPNPYIQKFRESVLAEEPAINKAWESFNAPGYLYKVDLPDEQIAKMLDYDLPLANQPEQVKESLLQLNDPHINEALSTRPVYNEAGDYWSYMGNTYGSKNEALQDVTPMQLISGQRGSFKSPQEASQRFYEAGIPGIQYLDQASRGAGEGTRNYVVFSDEIPQILERNGQPIAQALRDYRGAHTAPGPEFGAQLHDLTGGGQMYPDDVYSANAYRFYGHGGPDVALDKETTKIAQSFRGKPDEMVDIYRAVPNEADITSINAGDWITINPNYAKQHGESQLGGDYKILQQKVPAKTIWTNADSIHEYGYWPE